MNIVVVGLGSVGLPMAVWLASKNFRVVGVDINAEHVAVVNSGYSDLQEVVPSGEDFRSLLSSCLKKGTFTATSEYHRVKEGEHVFLFTVGVPVCEDGSCDQRPLTSAAESLAKLICQGDLVIIKSTLVPGTMRDLLIPLLKKSGLVPGTDFSIAYCPERLAEGTALPDFDEVCRLVSAEDAVSLARALEFWRTVSGAECVPVGSFLVAELSKVIENLHRDANIAISNELFPLANRLEVNFQELQSAVNTHPRVQLLSPGPGVGGHCLPNALSYLYPLSVRCGVPLNLVTLARKVNSDRPRQVASSVLALCRSLRGEITSIVILGLGMKDYCTDTRYSPALDLEKELKSQAVTVRTYDPVIQKPGEHLGAVLQGATAAVITVFQDGMGPKEILAALEGLENPPILFDPTGRVPKSEGLKAGVVVYYV